MCYAVTCHAHKRVTVWRSNGGCSTLDTERTSEKDVCSLALGVVAVLLEHVPCSIDNAVGAAALWQILETAIGRNDALDSAGERLVDSALVRQFGRGLRGALAAFTVPVGAAAAVESATGFCGGHDDDPPRAQHLPRKDESNNGRVT